MVQRYAILSVLAVPGRAVLTLSLLLLTRHHIRIWIHGDFPTIVVPVPVQSVIAPVTKIAQSQTTTTYSFHIRFNINHHNSDRSKFRVESAADTKSMQGWEVHTVGTSERGTSARE